MMLRLAPTLVAVAIAAAAASACSDSSPSSPSDSSAGSGSVTVPRPAQPTANAAVRFADQPVTLMVQNATVTITSGTTYTFEVATDAAFASKVQTKDSVSEGSGGQTTVKLDALAGGRDYYWHARATGGGTTGPFSATYKFTVGPAVVVNAPAPISPINGATTSQRPTLRVTNATRSNATGAISYLFEVANSAAFTSVIASATRTEGVNETGFTLTSDLPNNTTLYWRATATDTGSGVSSGPGAVQSFATRGVTQAEAVAAQLGLTLWPGVQPPGTVGHATMGRDWEIQTLHYVPGNVDFHSPDLEMLRFFDMVDHGFDPDGATAWMNANGYPTNALWYPGPEKAVEGFRYVYLATRDKIVVNAIWDVVLRVE